MKAFRSIASLIIIIGAVFLSFYSLMPTSNEEQFVPPNEFSVDRAMTPLLEMTKNPHFTGSEAHAEVRNIIIKELHKAGLEPHIQEGFSLNEQSKTLTKPINILAKFPGSDSSKALLLVSHYDSAPVPSYGAADAASGVVTILESIRAYLSSGARPKNDIIVLFTDAEELGLDGARLFVKEHPWAKDIGVALNFEARGTSGPSNMIIESTEGNARLIEEFIKANPKYPVASSLMYSVYKILPNDTDSTIFKNDGNIDGYFFAFIDNHFHYHTALDTYYNLDRNSLMHHGSYLLPLIHHFANADLSDLSSTNDKIYFSLPFLKFISYPFSWATSMFLIAVALFVFLLFMGFRNKTILLKHLIKGFFRFTVALLASGLFGFLGWKLILIFYPHYAEIQQGFPYNGHAYIAFFVALSIILTLSFFRNVEREQTPSFFTIPIFIWLVLNAIILIYLKGAAYFIIPVFFALGCFGIMIYKKDLPILHTVLSLPLLFIFAPLIQFFPVGLGMKNIFISCIFIVLFIGLLIPVWTQLKMKKLIGLITLFIGLFFLIKAHFQSDFSETRKKPNSLVYIEDANSNQAFWTTYDKTLDEWTSLKIPEKSDNLPLKSSYSKYGIAYKSYKETTYKGLKKSEVVINLDTIIGDEREIDLTITPQRNLNIIELFSDTPIEFKNLRFNDLPVDLDLMQNTYRGKENSSIVRYVLPHSQDPLNMRFTIPASENPSLNILEYHFDLLENSELDVEPRKEWMMPKPFVLTDATVVKQKILL